MVAGPLPGRPEGRAIFLRDAFGRLKQLAAARLLLQNFGSMFLHLLVWLFGLFVFGFGPQWADGFVVGLVF